MRGKPLPPKTHDGSIGHWLENQFGVSANNYIVADWNGYEIKTGKTKTTFGDWSASSYLWKIPNSPIKSREEFLKIFGTQSNASSPNRYSWSGRSFPTVKDDNSVGQIIVVEANDDIQIKYDFSKDKRTNKSEFIPESFQRDGVILARWNHQKLKTNVNKKFGQKGWVKFVAKKGCISEMIIGPPLQFEEWIEHVKSGNIYLDSGMYFDPDKPNDRPYSNWRAPNSFWESLQVKRVS